MNAFVDVFDAREWIIMDDGQWVRNILTNESILLARFTEAAQDGIRFCQGLQDIKYETHPETLGAYLSAKGMEV